VARRPASLIKKRGPKPMPPASLSGSASTVLRIWNVAEPMVTRSPVLSDSRASSAGSAAAPNAPSCSPSRSESGSGGASVNCPSIG
jgi:hypothetical protein